MSRRKDPYFLQGFLILEVSAFRPQTKSPRFHGEHLGQRCWEEMRLRHRPKKT